MMKFFSTILILFIITFSSVAESSHFITGFEDIPLMNGLQQTETDDFSFGNEEAHYIEAQLVSIKNKSFADIKSFYKETLTQLGWKKTKETKKQLSFTRENDTLEISKTSHSPLKISIILKNRI